MALSGQWALAGVSRSWPYMKRAALGVDDEDLRLCRLIDEQYRQRPFYGSRRRVVYLKQAGCGVNRKRVQRLMRQMGLAGMAPGPNTSRPHPEHKVYPYLLRGLAIERPNPVWSTDITYIRLARGFAYLVAILDWYSRKVLAWELSNCLRHYDRPAIFNTDQGSQFTSEAVNEVLKGNGVAIRMDGRGRALDNLFVERLWRSVEHEDLYLKGYATMSELRTGLGEYFAYYNTERPHQGLNYRTPREVYRSGIGGGATLIEK